MISWPVALGWALGWALLWRVPRLDAPRGSIDGGTGERPVVSVIIPARDEADRLPILLGALGRQEFVAREVIVVDDHSSDGTASVASSFDEVDVINAPPLPDGWAGKPWACSVGARVATGDVLVFLDADVDLAPDAMGSLVSTWQNEGGLVSVQPRHDTVRPVEALSLPFNVVSMMGLGIASVRPPRSEWGATGPCVITSRVDYERVGGHRVVADQVAEDLALAQRYRAVGLPVTCRGGDDRVRYRMYRDLRSLVGGWSKNLATGARCTPAGRAAVIAVWVTAVLLMAWRLFERPGSPAELATWALTYAAGVGQFASLGRRVGRFGPAAALWPLLIGFFVAVFVLSAVRILVLREVRWSGRRIPSPRR